MKQLSVSEFKKLTQRPVTRAFIVIGIITFIAAALVGLFEGDTNEQFNSFWDAVWWVIVTISTVGYGDRVPVTPAGRIIGVVIIFLGMASISVITATIATVFVTRKIREDKGLQEIKLKGHILICGWNENAGQILSTFENEEYFTKPVVLINQLAEEDAADVLAHHEKMTIKFVRGDFTRENILQRANAPEASAAVVLPDSSLESAKSGDERTILATLSLKTINPKIKVYAHIIDRENLSHIRKARADEVMVSDAYTGYLLANYVVSPGVPQFVAQLFSADSTLTLKRRPLPPEFINKTYGEWKNYYQDRGNGILLGLGNVAEPFNISELLSDDYSYLDQFIMRKFHEAGRGGESSEQVKIEFNPADDVTLHKNHFYIAIESKST
ncbi:MAG: hypothetical protein GF313_00690 [Caldithrix sp.]|nr:hypothetical protein [Caldithrix sp.]